MYRGLRIVHEVCIIDKSFTINENKDIGMYHISSGEENQT